MSYQKITINNFRGIKNLEIDDIKRINLFVGKNNCGKTSVLESILLLTAISNPGLNININNYRNYIHTNPDDFKLIFHNFDLDIPISIDAIFTNSEHRKNSITPIYIGESEQAIIQNNDTYVSDSEKIKTLKGLKLNFETNENGKPLESSSSITIENGNFVSKIQPNYKETLKIAYIIPKSDVNVNIQNLSNMIDNKQKSEIIKILKEIDSRISDISIGVNQNTLKLESIIGSNPFINANSFIPNQSIPVIKVDIGLPQLMPINMMGDGTRKFLSISTALYSVKDGILLIDEIEDGLGFSVLKDFWKAIISIAERDNVQVFATTHNIETLKSLNEVLKEDLPEFRQDVRNYNLSKLDNDNTKAYKYDFEAFEHAIEQNIEIRD